MVTDVDRSSLTGLSREEVRKRVEAGAVNRVPKGPSRTVAVWSSSRSSCCRSRSRLKRTPLSAARATTTIRAHMAISMGSTRSTNCCPGQARCETMRASSRKTLPRLRS